MEIQNKKAHFEYTFLEKLEAGIMLAGGEVKAIKNGRADISNAYAKVIDGEIFLVNANIPVEGKKDYNPTQSRKLLLHKKEILQLITHIKAKRLTLIPLKLYTKRRLVKLQLALSKAKRTYEKKEDLKRRDLDRELEKEFKDRI